MARPGTCGFERFGIGARWSTAPKGHYNRRDLRFAIYLIAFSFPAAFAADTLTNFRHSPVISEYGAASEVEFSTPLMELEAGSLAHHLPAAMKNLRFDEPVWVIGYKTAIVDRQGKTPRENYLCHTFLADQHVDQHPEYELKGIYSDAFTPEVRLPAGFGILFTPSDPLHWMPMFNNRLDDPVRVAMKVVLTVIRAKDLTKPLKPLYANLRSVQAPHLFFVPPGKDERAITFTLPFEGSFHFLGTHLHPYGASVELFNVSRNETVWRGRRTGGPESPMEVYTSSGGYAFHAGETFQIRSIYDNPTKEKIDAMAGLFMLYARK